jgi:hypothetical protein
MEAQKGENLTQEQQICSTTAGESGNDNHHDHCDKGSVHPKQTLCVAQLQFEEFEAEGGWKFYHSSYPMFSAKQLDLISDTVGTMGMPEVFYGFNHLYIANAAKDVLVEFSPAHALSLAAFAK